MLCCIDQVGFYQFVVLPLYSALAERFPGTESMLDNATANYNHWVHIEEVAKLH
jgi:hypothetical protein